jgi:phage-related protein
MPSQIRFYVTESGRRDVRSFLRALPLRARAKCISYLKQVREHGTNLPANIVKHIERGLWEARPEYGGIEYRYFFIHNHGRVGIVSAVVKKREKIERRVIETALRRAEELRKAWQEEADEPRS